MNFRESVIISCLVIFLVIGGFIGYGIYQDNIKMHQNYIQAKDAFRNGKFKEAEKLLEGNPPRDILKEFYLLKFKVLLNQNKLSEAEQTGLKLSEKYPDDAFINYLLSLIYYNTGDSEKTESYLKSAVKNSPETPDYKYALANFYNNSGDYERSIKLYEELAAELPDYEVIQMTLILAYKDIGDINKAFECAQKAFQIFNKSPYFAYVLADLYNQFGQKDFAAEYFAKAAELDVTGSTSAKTRYFEITGKPYLAAAQFKTEKIPYSGKDGLIIINASFNGIKGRFLVDTGAVTSVVYGNFIKNSNIKLKTNIFGLAQSANGETTVVPVVSGFFKLGNSEFKNVRTFVMLNDNMPFDGIIGNNIIQNTDYFVDRQRRTITIKSVQ